MKEAILAALFLAPGFGAGFIFFAALRRSVKMMTEGGDWRVVAGLYVVRFLVAGGTLFWAVQFGAAALLCAAIGFTAARFAVARSERGASV